MTYNVYFNLLGSLHKRQIMGLSSDPANDLYRLKTGRNLSPQLQIMRSAPVFIVVK